VKTNITGNIQSGLIDDDTNHMNAAFNLARRGLGNVWPNPAVGCVITNNNRVVGRGWTMPGGHPHAETEAIRRAGKLANGGTAYVTLEPCNHYGQTPPCTDALIAAGIKKVIVATQDPDNRVMGTGIIRLKEAGISVEIDFSKSTGDEVNQGFFSRIKSSRPYITLKVATTLDGKIGTHSGESKWITGATARRWAHQLRANHDTIMIGSGTALADNPTLTCRLAGITNERRTRIVLDGRLRLSEDCNLAQTAKDVPVMVFTSSGDAEKEKKISRLQDLGVILIISPNRTDPLDFKDVFMELTSRGVTRLFVEGGGTIAASLVNANFVDEIAWFRAPSIIGNDGIPAIDGLNLDKLSEKPIFTRKSLITLGEDSLEILSRK
jgi:diaminohydroxyphosphoribosylaminopyrimidine deaminase/5-amino-6-(5-phosphoribosylamino)uracil reductase